MVPKAVQWKTEEQLQIRRLAKTFTPTFTFVPVLTEGGIEDVRVPAFSIGLGQVVDYLVASVSDELN